MNKRQQTQHDFDQSKRNLVVGEQRNCPISPEQLAATTNQSDYVVETFSSGLTAEVFHIRIDGNDYTLKKRRPVAKVKNLDGQYSFLNEVQRRHDFQTQKKNPNTSEAFSHIVNTIYANYRLGIILSDWIEGEPIAELNPSILEQLFTTLVACEQIGQFEWDLCPGNLLVDNSGKLWLFDFGYMYSFNPLTEFNSNGLTDSMFNFCERFETRFFSGWLLKNQYSQPQSIALYKQIKLAALTAIHIKLGWLESNNADEVIIDYWTELKQSYEQATQNDVQLKQLFTLELFRSHVLDIEDDLEGKSCTPITVQRVRTVIDMVKEHYQLLKRHGALFYHNEDKKNKELIEAYQTKLLLAEQYQL